MANILIENMFLDLWQDSSTLLGAEIQGQYLKVYPLTLLEVLFQLSSRSRNP